ncbi:MAG: hypothetical protein IJ025_07060 [Clostridia bacterium]|nr:hypothetical protein [Clostridia bacterium]
MFAVILERCNKKINECFGVKSTGELTLFDTDFESFINKSISQIEPEKIFKLSVDKDGFFDEILLRKLKNQLLKSPDNRTFLMYDDTYFEIENFIDLLMELPSKTGLENENKQLFSCVLNNADLYKILSEKQQHVSDFLQFSAKNFHVCSGYVKIIEKPNDFKGFCIDILKGKVGCILPEVAQGIFADSDIPKGDFVLIPPVYFGENVQIEKGCVIGPFTVISSGGLIAENSFIRNCFIGSDTYVSSGCLLDDCVISKDVSVRRNSIVFKNSVICEGATVGEETIIEENSFIKACSRVDDFNKKHINFKNESNQSPAGFYGYMPENASLLGAATGVAFNSPKIAVAGDGELNSTALKLALIGGLMTTGAACYDFGNTFLSSLHYFMEFCELDYAVFVSGNYEGTVISIFEKNSVSLKKSDYYNIKNLMNSGNIERCKKENCKSIRQIHGMQRMYIQFLSNMFDKSLDFMPVFKSENKRILSVAELAVSKIGFKSGKGRVVFNVNHSGEKVTAECDGIIYSHSKLFETVSYFRSQDNTSNVNDLWKYDGVILAFVLMSYLNKNDISLKNAVKSLPAFYIAEKEIACKGSFGVLASDLSKNNSIKFKKDEILFKDGSSTVKINKNQNGSLRVTAKAFSLEAAREIIDNLSRIIDESEYV